MPYFTYWQNNSGGSFDRPAIYVIVEAATAEEANAIAEMHGIYFNGCEAGEDCECCGDRWGHARGEGDAEPLIYGQSVIEYLSGKYAGMWAKPKRGIHEVMLIYKDGAVEFMDAEGK